MDGICSECKEPCEAIILDFGIGSYEYFGAVGNHKQLAVVSNCCEAPVYINSSMELITIEMINEDYEL
jgi:hypothetical protein